MRSFPIMKIGQMQQQRENYMIKILTQGIDIIERRSKRNDVCKQHWWNDDDEIIDDMVKDVGCTLKYWNTNSSVPICQLQQDYISLRTPTIVVVDDTFLKKYIPPCREIQTIMFSNTVSELKGSESQKNSDPYSIVKVQFKSTMYKMIRNVRAFNEESLIGNLGGYVGLFLGVAFWQAPVYAAQLMNKVKYFKKVLER